MEGKWTGSGSCQYFENQWMSTDQGQLKRYSISSIKSTKDKYTTPTSVHISLYIAKIFNASEFLEFKLQHKSKDRIEKEMFDLVPLTPEGYITKE